MTIKLQAAQRLLAETVPEYLRRLIQLKIRRLGAGAFAHVFQHPTMPNVAVKLVPFTDTGYESYLAFCRKHKSNRYCPRILGVRRKDEGFDPMYRGGESVEYTIVFMEKLQPITYAAYAKFGRFIRSQLDPEERKYWKRHHVQDMLCSSDVWLSILGTDDKELREIARFLSDPPDPLDLHQKNLMLRGTQVVITDPLS